MLLVIDIGNTDIGFGVFEEENKTKVCEREGTPFGGEVEAKPFWFSFFPRRENEPSHRSQLVLARLRVRGDQDELHARVGGVAVVEVFCFGFC